MKKQSVKIYFSFWGRGKIKRNKERYSLTASSYPLPVLVQYLESYEVFKLCDLRKQLKGGINILKWTQKTDN